MKKLLLAAIILGAHALPANALQGGLSIMPGAAALSSLGLVHKATSEPRPYVGARVSCNWQGRGKMYRGRVVRKFGNGTLRIHYDDGDRETTSISMCRVLSSGPVRPGGGWGAGTRVSCDWKGRGRMYSGTIAKRYGPTSIRVHYDDGDRETTSISSCRKLAGGAPKSGWQPGARIASNWQGRGKMYSGVIARRLGGSRIRVHYNDGDRETTHISNCRLR